MVWLSVEPQGVPGWVPKNEAEWAMDEAVARGDMDEFLRVFVTAEIYMPRVPKRGVVIRSEAPEWEPMTRLVANRVSVPVFTSLAGMGSAVVAPSYAVTRFDELADHGVAADCGLEINLATPLWVHLPVALVALVARGERLFSAAEDDEAYDGDDDPAAEVDEPTHPGHPPQDRAARRTWYLDQWLQD